MNTSLKLHSHTPSETHLKIKHLSSDEKTDPQPKVEHHSHPQSDDHSKKNGHHFIKIHATLYLRRTPDSNLAQDPSPGLEDISINPFSSQIIRVGFSPVKLTRIELNLITFLFQSFGFSIHRGDLIRMIWPENQQGSQSFDVHIYNLRRKLKSMDLMIHFSPPGLYSLGKIDHQGKQDQIRSLHETSSFHSILN